MKVVLAQFNATVGDLAGNARRLAQVARQAHADGARVVLAPELALCGYPPRDFLDVPEFLERVDRTLAELAQTAEWSRGVAYSRPF